FAAGVAGLQSMNHDVHPSRKAKKWLEGEGVEVRLRDVRQEPLSEAEAKAWLADFGAERLVNRRGTTWRGLSDEDKAAAEGEGAAKLLSAHPATMKRPLFEAGDRRILGFGAAEKANLLDLLQK
ncbi:MAG: ArsC/Spx/MgsR family protein, partial [Pseudomonadota bacterium]